MNEAIKTYAIKDPNGNPARAVIYQDYSANNPLDYEGLNHAPILWCEHHHYNLGHDNGKAQIQEAIRNHAAYKECWEDYYDLETNEVNENYLDLDDPADMVKALNALSIPFMCVNMYRHSSISIWLDDATATSWDTGCLGLCVWPDRDPQEFMPGATWQEAMQAWFKAYQLYVSGDVYVIALERDWGLYNSKGEYVMTDTETIDVCSGFFMEYPFPEVPGILTEQFGVEYVGELD